MKEMSRVVLGLWLLVVGIVQIFSVGANAGSLGLFAMLAGGVLAFQTPNLRQRRGLLLLVIFLVADGLAAWLPIPFENYIVAVLAIAAGVLLALDNRDLLRQVRMLLLVIFLLMYGIALIVGIPFEGLVLGVLGMAAGVLMLLNR